MPQVCQRRPLIKALLIDISGNLHVGNTPTPDAVNAFHRLRACQHLLPFRLCSNTSKESTQSLISRLNNLGFGVRDHHSQDSDSNKVAILGSRGSEDVSGGSRADDGDGDDGVQLNNRQEVWTSIGAVAQYIQNQGLKRPYILLSPSAKEEITHDDMVLLPPPPTTDSPNKSEYDCVVVGLAPELLDYAHLNTAFRILKGETTARSEYNNNNNNAGVSVVHDHDLSAMAKPKPQPCRLIATHKAKYIQTENPNGLQQQLSLGPGPFVSALEMATGIKAHVIGKPTRLFFETVINDFYASGELEQTQVDVERGLGIAVIGDDVEADLGDGAIQMGLWRILVRTGKYRNGDESRPGIIPPDEVFDSFAAFIDSVLSTQS